MEAMFHDGTGLGLRRLRIPQAITASPTSAGIISVT
jgi:hypothetical protein